MFAKPAADMGISLFVADITKNMPATKITHPVRGELNSKPEREENGGKYRLSPSNRIQRM